MPACETNRGYPIVSAVAIAAFTPRPSTMIGPTLSLSKGRWVDGSMGQSPGGFGEGTPSLNLWETARNASDLPRIGFRRALPESLEQHRRFSLTNERDACRFPPGQPFAAERPDGFDA
jgi:hypothetical protein